MTMFVELCISFTIILFGVGMLFFVGAVIKLIVDILLDLPFGLAWIISIIGLSFLVREFLF